MAPGSVPIGGMMAVMPATHANAWQPPADCTTIKDGFMRTSTNAGVACVVPTCADCAIPAGTTLPNMWQTYPRGGATTSNTGSSNTVSLAANQIPTLSTAGQSATHTHSWGGHWSNDDAKSVTGGDGDGTQNTYSDGIWGGIWAWGTGGGTGMYYSRQTNSMNQNASHNHRLVNSGALYMGSTEGGAADWVRSVYGRYAADTYANQWYAEGVNTDHSHEYWLPSHRHYIRARNTGNGSGDHTHTITNGSLQAVSREPAYREVVWVIRVK